MRLVRLLCWFSGVFVVASSSMASAQLRVGPGEAYATIGAAAAAATDGATIEIQAGTYHEEVVWPQSGLTIRGIGGRPVVDMTGLPLTRQGGKGIFIVDGANVTLENLEFVGAAVPDGNGAGIRWQGGGQLTVRSCVFRDNENGILGGNHADNVALIELNEFVGNGRGDFGYTHNLYINEIDTLTFRGNWSHALVAGSPDSGHLFKSRARRNFVLYNRLTAEGSPSSYELQLPEGGEAVVLGNVIEQGAMGPNRTVVSIGGDGMQWASPHVVFVHNTVVNHDTRGTFLSATAPIVLDVVNNLFVGPGELLTGGTLGRMDHNVRADGSVFVDAARFDYHLVAGSAPVDAGVDPGTDGAWPVPAFEYAHPAGVVARRVDGAPDVGAYELAAAPAADAGPGATDAGVVADAGRPDGDSGAGPEGDGGGLAGLDAGGGAGGTRGGCCHVAGGGRGPGASGLLVAAALASCWIRRRR
jgi:hypothetical protein